MKNKHLNHPEDAILLEGREGLYKVLSFFKDKNSILSVKYDGSPAVVWGINPENKKFFVGTKSVFNKIKIKINYTHYDIEIESKTRTVEIPLVYGGEYGPDLKRISNYSGKSESEVIKLHSEAIYIVNFIGFSIGFPY